MCTGLASKAVQRVGWMMKNKFAIDGTSFIGLSTTSSEVPICAMHVCQGGISN